MTSEPRFFTLRANGILQTLVTDIIISLPMSPEVLNSNPGSFYQTKGLWDTGASCTCINPTAAEAAGLIPIGRTMMSHAGGDSEANIYLINIVLPNGVVVTNVEVIEFAGAGDGIEVLIGMDVITLGDFALTNLDGETVFSFRIPSSARIDFAVPPHKISSPHLATNTFSKTGRNDLCPCGSGKKYKLCHGNKATGS